MEATVRKFYAEEYEDDDGDVYYCVCKRYWKGGYDVVSSNAPSLAAAEAKAERLNAQYGLGSYAVPVAELA